MNLPIVPAIIVLNATLLTQNRKLATLWSMDQILREESITVVKRCFKDFLVTETVKIACYIRFVD